MERKLNFLNFDRDGIISFEEFVFVIFSLLNFFYFDILLLNLELRLMFKLEKIDVVDLGVIGGNI